MAVVWARPAFRTPKNISDVTSSAGLVRAGRTVLRAILTFPVGVGERVCAQVFDAHCAECSVQAHLAIW